MNTCKHERARVVSRGNIDPDWINCVCTDCKRAWMGMLTPWTSRRGRYHKPPKWVTKTAQQESDDA